MAFSTADFRQIVRNYAQNSGVKMNFQKETYLKLLQKTKTSTGHIMLSKGSMLLNFSDALKTRILFDRNYLWYMTAAEGEKRKIIKIDLKTSSKGKTLLSFLFYPDLLFKEFRFVSSRTKGRTWILNFEPADSGSEIESFSIKVDGKLILKTWFKWKNPANEEIYTFSNIRFNQTISKKNFQINEMK